MNNKAKYFLLIWSQVGWFGCVYAEKLGISWSSLLFPIIAWITLWKFKLLDKKLTLQLLACAVIGMIFDALEIYLGHITTVSSFTILPVWLVSMWLLFVTILPHLAQLFSKRLGLAVIVGFIAGPLTYKSGEAFEVLFIKDNSVLIQYGLFWALFFSGAVYFLRKEPNENR